jgi:two-component system chemotaxis sensor kinase CheA
MPGVTELKRQIEDLALQLVMAEPGERPGSEAPPWMSILERVRETAERERAPRASAAAAALLETVRISGGAAELQEGMARLQEAMEAEERTPDAAGTPLGQDPELLLDFVLESREHLASIETQVLTLERDPHGAEALNAVFRGFHTIKGLAGFLELWDIQKVAHEVETLLDRARNSELTVTPAAIDVILESADDLRRRLAHVEAGLNGETEEAPGPNEPLLGRIGALNARPAAVAEAAGDALRLAVAVENSAGEGNEEEGSAEEGKNRSLTFAARTVAAPTVEGRTVAAPTVAGRTEPETEMRKGEAMAVKVDTAKLDSLVDMAGEMVIAQSLVRHDPDLAAIKSPRLARNMAQLTRMTAELQKTAMAMRLVPIGPLFRRMERMVRDLSRQFGKRVEMETQGDEIELDRNIVQELTDPLMHMVRNALDHGIETPAERERAGKNPVAHVVLKGRHQAGQVVIEIADDGRGLDRARILEKAIQKGLIASGDGISDNDIYNLIFQPGFSTAAQVTNVSGRGVGMDVVRRHIEKLRGRVEIRSAAGQGATFALKLPLTLAIIDGLVVGVGEERYIAPLFAVREVLRPAEETIWTVQQRAEMALIRGELLPVLRLYRKFRVTPRSEDPRQSVLLVAEVDDRRSCLLVDELIGKQEVVIKTLGETFKSVTGIAGGAILGDGRVGLILDLERLFREGADGAGN